MGVFTTKTDLANQTLYILGQESKIADLDAVDPSNKPLTALQDNYPVALEMVFRDCRFDLSSQFIPLVKLCDQPTKEWRHAFYLPPSAFMGFKRIFSGIYPDSRETEVPHRKVTSLSGSAASITAITQANPGVLTVPGLVNGQVVLMAGIGGMTQLNGNSYIVAEATATTCQLLDLTTGLPIDTTSFTAYTTGGTATPEAHWRILTNIWVANVEVVQPPDISLWPADFGMAVATKLAVLAGTSIVGVDHKDFVDSLKVDYINIKRNALANAGKETFKGVRPLSSSTLSRLSRGRPRQWGC